MTDNLNTFERLVRTLESSERRDMLRKLADTSELRSEEARNFAHADILSGEGRVIPEERFRELNFIVRLWFGICSIFSQSSPIQLFERYMIDQLGKKLLRSAGTYIDTRQRLYLSALYQEIKQLKNIQNFFSSLLASYEDDKGGFYVILSTLAMKKTAEAIASAADPFVFPTATEDHKDIRLTCVRAMDSVLNTIPPEERARMYQAAQGIEWMRKYCAVPLERILLRFDIISGIAQGCTIDSVSEEMKSLVNILSSARKIPVLMLEALFLFSEQENVRESGYDLEKECSGFLKTATDYITVIGEFKTKVPLADFVRFSTSDVSWQPQVTESGEDWFALFRNAWRKRFDQRWTLWNREHRRAMLSRRMRDYLDLSDLPPILHHPWEGIWLSLSLRRELSLRFLKGFFKKTYPQEIMKPLKVVLIEGDFYKRENLMEYTDAFSMMEHGMGLIDAFEQRLSPKGDIGEGFELIIREKLATVKGKARIESLMLTAESDAESIISRILTAFTSVDLILGGVLEISRSGPYETLVNMASIQGKQNERFRKDLTQVRQYIREASIIVTEAEKIEKEAL